MEEWAKEAEEKERRKGQVSGDRGVQRAVSLKPSNMKRKSEGGGQDWSNAVHEALKLLSSYCDGAHDRDNMGFNKFDTAVGKYLAQLSRLNLSQAKTGRAMLYKYHRQIPKELWCRIGFKTKK